MEQRLEQHGLAKWVEYLRKDIFTYSQKQFVEFLQEAVPDLNKRYIAGLEDDAKTIRIDVLETLLKCLGIDFDKIREFYEKAKAVAKCFCEKNVLCNEIERERPFEAFLDNRPVSEEKLNNLRHILSNDLFDYIQTLVYIHPAEFGKNRIIDMQSLNFFWTYAAIEYVIARQRKQALTDKTKDALYTSLLKLINQGKAIYIKTAQRVSKEEINEFDAFIAELEEGNYSNQFAEIRKKDVQLEYKVELRKLRILECLLEVGLSALEKIDKILGNMEIRALDDNQADMMDKLAEATLGMVRMQQVFIHGDSSENKEIKILLGKNMFDIIYTVAYYAEYIKLWGDLES